MENSHYKLIVVDEIAQLLESPVGSEISERLRSIAEKGRKFGVGLVLCTCTQYPKTDILKSTITVNINNRIAFKLQSPQQSKVVIDIAGAEKLQGKGDCLSKFGDQTEIMRYLSPVFVGEKLKAA